MSQFLRLFTLVVSICCSAAVVAAAPATFSPTSFPGASKPRTIVAADFNRDGRLDLATGGTGSGSIAVLLNDTRDGTGFRPGSTIVVGGGPFDLATGDLNRDGNVDLIVANADSDAVTILLGRGDGTFNAKRDVAVGGNPRGIAVADMNGDGRLDILATQFASNKWTLLLGDGAGGVIVTTSYATATRPQGIAVADLNHDGQLDAIVANAGSAALSVFFSAGRANARRADTPIPVPVNVLTVGDFNADGWLDVAGASTDRSSAVLLKGSSSGLRSPVSLSTGSSPRGITAIDLNQDGRLDLAIANRASNTLTLHFGRGDGTFSSTSTIAAGLGSRGIAAADFDRDGLVDLASVNELDSTVSLFTNTTSLVSTGFAYSVKTLGTVQGGGDHQFMDVGDFDEDGKVDVIQLGAPSPRIFFGNGRLLDLPGRPGSGLAVGDVNGDGHRDVIVTVHEQNSVVVYRGDGRGGFTGPTVVASINGPEDVDVGDFNRDGRLDLVTDTTVPATNDHALQIWLGQGDGTFSAGVSIPTHLTNGFAVADIDRDGRLDLVVNEFENVVTGLHVHYGDGDGGWRSDTFVPLDEGAGAVRVADFNGDGRLDLAATSNGEVAIALANPTGFDPVTTQGFPAGYQAYPFRLGVGDYDLDGDVDIVTSDADVLVNQGDATFKALMFAGGGEAPVIADFTADGLPDLLFANAGALTVLVAQRNESNRPPTVSVPDRSVSYPDTFEEFFLEAIGSDPDQHDLRYEWRDASGKLLGTEPQFFPGSLKPATYTFTVTAFDDRGGKASDTMTLTVTPFKELYAHVAMLGGWRGGWRQEVDVTAASGRRVRHPDTGAAKLSAPLASPTNYFEFVFIADPTQAYKLWIRGKADGNSPYNDSAFVQFSGAVDAAGKPAWGIGTTSALAFNLEECSGCAISGWGWEDDAWGAKNANGVLIRFPAGGRQVIRVQTREDGLSIDQIVLSSEKYLTARPGSAKNDATILARTVFDDD